MRSARPQASPGQGSAGVPAWLRTPLRRRAASSPSPQDPASPAGPSRAPSEARSTPRHAGSAPRPSGRGGGPQPPGGEVQEGAASTSRSQPLTLDFRAGPRAPKGVNLSGQCRSARLAWAAAPCGPWSMCCSFPCLAPSPGLRKRLLGPPDRAWLPRLDALIIVEGTRGASCSRKACAEAAGVASGTAGAPFGSQASTTAGPSTRPSAHRCASAQQHCLPPSRSIFWRVRQGCYPASRLPPSATTQVYVLGGGYSLSDAMRPELR